MWISLEQSGEAENVVDSRETNPESGNNSEKTFSLSLENTNVGDTVLFGKYEQDNNTANGKEDIEWIVLEKDDGKALVISKYGLDSIQYSNIFDRNISVPWESSYIRTWLNDSFYRESFDENQKKMIRTSSFDKKTDRNTYAESDNDTGDKLFLLSVTEIEQFFKTKESRICIPTEYHERYQVPRDWCLWWVRSKDDNNGIGISIDGSGNFHDTEFLFMGTLSDCAARPAMWISLEQSGEAENVVDSREKNPESGNNSEKTFSLSVKNTNVGDTVLFGSYEQDNDFSNGKEEIEWIVIAKEEGKALVLSKYALDSQPYDSSITSIYQSASWRSCPLRFWLNDTFLKNAFDSDELKMIEESEVSTKEMYNELDTPDVTTDKIFLLSADEIQTYFNIDIFKFKLLSSKAKCSPTKSAIAQNESNFHIVEENGKYYCDWWLRYTGSPAWIACDGSYTMSQSTADTYLQFVRPALWINLNAY